jgi:hypothetical protein
MIRGKLLQIGVKLLVAVRQYGVPLFRLDPRRTLILQLLLETGFFLFDLSTKRWEIIQQDVLALQYNIQLAGKLRNVLKSTSEAVSSRGDRMRTCRSASVKRTFRRLPCRLQTRPPLAGLT